MISTDLCLLFLNIFKPEVHCQAFSETVPGLGLVGVVQLLSLDHHLPVFDEASVEPEIKWTFLIILRHLSGTGLKENPGVPPDDGAVDQLDSDGVCGRVVGCLAVVLSAKMCSEDGVPPALVYLNPEV